MRIATALKDMILVLSSVMLASIAQILLKVGMTRVGRVNSFASAPVMLLRALTNPFVLSGLMVFGISSLTWLSALSRVKLSIAYPMVSLGYVIVVIFSWLVLKESVKPITFIGCATVIIGVFLISKGL